MCNTAMQEQTGLALLDNILSLIDMRSFSSVWFWIVVALFWSAVTHTVLGVSYDLIVQARRKGGQPLADMQALVEIHVRRMLAMVRHVGHWIMGFVAAVLSLIFVLAFVYGLEMAQALFLLLLPLTITRLMALRLAFRIEREGMHAEKLIQVLLRHRLWVQLLGVVIIFMTAIWGMMRVMTASVLSI
ncbi:component of SufBCD complex [Roseinatronobacter sp.]|uniref:component of SufBCD complex n=1 Tax=Roseinatronobacter sp. TaxID=1945755 RepID=UPI003F6E8C81